MGNVIPVNDFKKIDKTRYKEGDIFLNKKQFAVLQDGQLEILVKQSDLKEYVKKKDVQKLIDDTLKKVEK